MKTAQRTKLVLVGMWMLGVGGVVSMVGWLAACGPSWAIPDRTRGDFAYRDTRPDADDSQLYTIPAILLQDKQIADASRNCAIAANQYRSEAHVNNFWSSLFGTLQVAGAGTGTVAGAAAFESGENTKAAKISAVSFAVAAGIAALDHAYAPGKLSVHQEQVSLKIGHLILLAALQASSGNKKDAMTSLSQCLDPDDVNDGTTMGSLEALTAEINRLLKGADGGAVGDAGPVAPSEAQVTSKAAGGPAGSKATAAGGARSTPKSSGAGGASSTSGG